MGEQIKRRAKNPDSILSWEILELFKKKGGVYAVAKRNDLQGTNLYSQIKRCDTALSRIRELLRLIDHSFKYEIVERKGGRLKK
jgi:hypothetical protein